MRHEEVEITPKHRPTEYVKAGALATGFALMFLFGLCILIVGVVQKPSTIGQFSSEVWNDLLIAIFAILLVGAVIGTCYAAWKLSRGTFIPVDATGGYWVSWNGKFRPLHPLTPLSLPAPNTTKVTEVKPSIIRLGDLITQGMLTRQGVEGVELLVGFRQDETHRYEPMPGVIAITGMQNVGKSVTMMMLIIIAVLQGAYVVVCDTHHTKARSLFKKIVALQGIVTFATTEEEVLKETRKFSEELSNRKQGSNPYPYVIFYDEFCSLIRSQNKELRDLLPTVMEEGSQEGQGYGLHIVAAIHDISNSGIGDAKLRSFWNWVFCHRMESGQSKFIEAFNTRKTKQVIASLPQGHVIVRDTVNAIEYLVIPFGDSKDVSLAKNQLLRLQSPAMKQQLPQHSGILKMASMDDEVPPDTFSRK